MTHAIRVHDYGGPDVLKWEQVEVGEPGPGEVKIEQTAVGRGRSRWGSDREYGYGFWIREFAGHKSFYAWGYGGQFIFVIPDLDLVVVTTSRSDVSRERRDHNDGIYRLVETLIVPVVRQG